MTYLVNNPNQRALPGSASNELKTLPQMAVRHPLELPEAGRVGETRPFDPMRLEINKAADGWHLTADRIDLGVLSQSEYQARMAMQIAQRYPFTEYVRIGNSDFGFYLSKHMAPRGVPLGIHQTSFQPKSLTVKQAGSQWAVTDGKHTIASLPNESEARQALAAIRHFGFNCACEAGPGLKYLALER
jgi:hypothetical protein